MPGLAGALYCSDDAGCGLYPVTVSNDTFSGVYGTGDAVAAAAAVVPVASAATAASSGVSFSSPSSTRRLNRLTKTKTKLRSGGKIRDGVAGGGAIGGDYVDDQVVRVRKEGSGDVLASEQDMVDMFLRRRYDKLL